jgi:excisionase family DNA binding protein
LIYTVKEAAKELKVCDRTLKNWLNTGTIKGFRLGKRWRISQEEINRIMEGK